MLWVTTVVVVGVGFGRFLLMLVGVVEVNDNGFWWKMLMVTAKVVASRHF